MTNLTLLKQLEHIVANTADRILNQYFLQTTAQFKTDGSIVTEADLAMQEALTRELSEIAPEIVMLGEEMNQQQQSDIINTGKAYWCLDPLDGTNNFHHGVPLYAISLALIRKKQVDLGIIYDPVRKEMFSSVIGSGLRINGEGFNKPVQPEQLNHCLASVDFKRLKSHTRQRLIEHMPFKSQRNVGSCALEWAWLATGRTQLLLHGGEKFWDFAAGYLLLNEADGFSCTHNRESVFNNSLQDRSVIAASDKSLHSLWLDFLLD